MRSFREFLSGGQIFGREEAVVRAAKGGFSILMDRMQSAAGACYRS
jgi:hypothetical protein